MFKRRQTYVWNEFDFFIYTICNTISYLFIDKLSEIENIYLSPTNIEKY